MTKYVVEINYTGSYIQEVDVYDKESAREIVMKGFLLDIRDFDDITSTEIQEIQ